MPRHIKTAALAGQQEEADAKTRATVEAIIADVRARGDRAVRELSERFDKWSPPSFRLSDERHRRDGRRRCRRRRSTTSTSRKRRSAISPRSSAPRCAMSRSRRCPGSCSAIATSRSAASAAMCRAGAIRWSPRRICRSSRRGSPGSATSPPARRRTRACRTPRRSPRCTSPAPTRSMSWAASRRSRRWRSAPRRSARSTCWSARATPMSPRPSASFTAGSASICSPARPRSSSSPTIRPTPRCARPTCWARPSTARPRRRSC